MRKASWCHYVIDAGHNISDKIRCWQVDPNKLTASVGPGIGRLTVLCPSQSEAYTIAWWILRKPVKTTNSINAAAFCSITLGRQSVCFWNHVCGLKWIWDILPAVMGRMNTTRYHRWLTGHHFIMTMDSRYVHYNSRSMHTVRVLLYYDIMSWKHFTWISLKIGQQFGALIFSFWLVWISCGTNRHVAGALSCCGTHLSLLWYTYGWCFVVFGCDLGPSQYNRPSFQVWGFPC